MQVSLILSLLIEHALLLWVDLKLDAIGSFGILSVNLVVHSEERQDGHDIGKNEVHALSEFEETGIVA